MERVIGTKNKRRGKASRKNLQKQMFRKGGDRGRDRNVIDNLGPRPIASRLLKH